MALSKNGGSYEAVRARINTTWLKWEELTSIVCGKHMPRKLKVKMFETVIQSVLLYGAELWTLTLIISYHRDENAALDQRDNTIRQGEKWRYSHSTEGWL